MKSKTTRPHLRVTHIAAATLLAMSSSLALAGGNPGHGHAHSDNSAIGAPGLASKVNRTVQVDMSDSMRFTPSSLDVKQGETIRFVVKNSGQVKHEFVLGTEADLKEHYEVMKKFPEMEHADPNMVSVDPGKTGELIWQFTKAGLVDFACLHPGHYEAGMKGSVKVVSGRPVKKAQPKAAAGANQQY